jgi:hypothetical protein
VDKVALGQVFSEYFGFPCQSSFRLLHTHTHHLSSGAGIIGQILADVPSGLSLTPPQETKKKKKKNFINSITVNDEQEEHEMDVYFLFVVHLKTLSVGQIM